MNADPDPSALWDLSLVGARTSPWGGYRVFDAARGGFIIDAPQADQAIIRDYPFWIDKGPIAGGTRLTQPRRAVVTVGELVRVAHIVEECAAGRTLYPVGPKPIRDEFIDGALVTASTAARGDFPWLPDVYDGEAAPSPGIDDNFEITEYRFELAGDHRIQWCPGGYRSNVLGLTVREPP